MVGNKTRGAAFYIRRVCLHVATGKRDRGPQAHDYTQDPDQRQ